MTRAEYMRQLESLLSSVPDAEKEEALQYYNDYFDDASDQEDDEIIKALGTPEELAESIKAGLSDDGNQGIFTEEGFKTVESKKDELGSFTGLDTVNVYSKGSNSTSESEDKRSSEAKEISEEDKKKSNDRVILLIVLGIIASPFIIGIIGTVFGIVAGIIGTIVGIAFGFIGLVIGLVVSSVALLVVGVLAMTQTGILSGLCIIGAGLICTAASIFSVWLCGLVINLSRKAIPYVWKGFVWVFEKCISIFRKEEVA